MPVKSRYPDRDFSHRPYLLWLKRVYAWLLTQVGESDYPSHEVGDLPPLIAALETALNNWESLHGIATDRSKFYTDASDALRKQLQLLKQIIPTLVDPHVMGSFGLDKSLPDSRDELGGVAEISITPLWSITPTATSTQSIDFTDFSSSMQTILPTCQLSR